MRRYQLGNKGGVTVEGRGIFLLVSVFFQGTFWAHAQTIEFIEDLRRGPADGEVFLWTSPNATVSVDGGGTMYVADPSTNRIMAYGPNGDYLRTVAGEGSGPGELKGLLHFRVLSEGGAVALELLDGLFPRLHYFDKTMGFVRFREYQGIPLILEIGLLSPLGDGFAAFYVQSDREKKQRRYETAAFDMTWNRQKSFVTKYGPMPDRSRIGQASYWSERIGENLSRFFSGTGVFNYDRHGHLFTAVTNQNEIVKWDLPLENKVLVIRREYKPKLWQDIDRQTVLDQFIDELGSDPELVNLITPGVLRQAMEQAELPPAKHVVFGIIPMWDGGVLVVRDIDLDTGMQLAEVFDADGQYLGKTELAEQALVRLTLGGYLPKMVFADSFAYTMATDGPGENVLIRYRYRLRAD